MKTEYRKLADLKKLPGNPRIIRDKEFKILCASIQKNPEYFAARPLILSNRTGELIIIAGNQRYEAAKTLKLEVVPTFLIENLTENKEREIIIRDNVQSGEWNFAILRDTWQDLPLLEWGLELPQSIDIKEEIINAEEWVCAKATADQIIDSFSAKIRQIINENPEKANKAMAIITTNGRGNSVFFLADPNTEDIVKELKRYADAGNYSPLETLIRAHIENNAHYTD